MCDVYFFRLHNIQPSSRKFVSTRKYPIFSIHQVTLFFFSLKPFSHSTREQKIGVFN